jgi:hypothetical protein
MNSVISEHRREWIHLRLITQHYLQVYISYDHVSTKNVKTLLSQFSNRF